MPYMIAKDGPDNKPFCVYKQDADGKPIGKTHGCHATEQGAKDQLAALYANEPDANKGRAAAVTKSEGDGDHPASHYLVVEDPQKPSTWHLRVKGMDGKPDHQLMGAAWAALHGGYRGNKYEGPNKAEAIAKLTALYKSEGIEPPSGRSLSRHVEYRTYQVQDLRISMDDAAQPHIRGYAAVFDSLSEPLMEFAGLKFRERIKPGAFAKTLREADIRALWNHNPDYVLGRNKAGTLALAEDEHGLAVDIVPPDTAWARDLMTSMKRGDVNQMSFGMNVIKDDWKQMPGGQERTLLEVRLLDVSPVTFPAYPATEVGVRSLINALQAYEPEPAQEDHSDEDVEALTQEPAQEDHSVTDAYRQRLAELDRRIKDGGLEK